MSIPKRKYYPIPPSGLDGFLYALAMGIFIGLFLWYFEPFNINVRGYSDSQILFFGVIVFLVFLMAHTIIPWLFPGIYPEQKWTIYSQILFYLILLLITATGNGLYINYVQQLSFNWANYWFIISRTIILGIIPISLFVLLNFYWKYSKMVENAAFIGRNLDIRQVQKEPQVYVIKTNIKDEAFKIKEDTFLFAKASGNYIEVYTTTEPSRLFRMNLSDFEQQIGAIEHWVRCHRSYIVNVQKVSGVSGNAQGLRLSIENKQGIVPVSRKYVNAIKRILT